MPRAAAVAAAAAASAAAAAARLVPPGPGAPEYVDGEYIAVLRRGVSAAAHGAAAARFAARAYAIGDGAAAFRALHARLDAARLRELAAHPDVGWVERDQVARAAGAARAAGGNATRAARPRACPDAQPEPVSWGQTRTTARSAADVAAVFAHDAGWGRGVDVYVLDTGVRVTHEEFGAPGGARRAEWGANFAGGDDQDANGHGTHVAGTVAGRTYGVAKSATVVAVKVLSDLGFGQYSTIISGIEWAAQRSAALRRGAVGTLSLGGAYSAALNAAVDAAAASGVLFAAAALNNDADACGYSPASAADGLCVAATELAELSREQVDCRAAFSNYGACADVFAPGSAIVSAYRGGDAAYATLSGTSMAAPHAAGVAAAALQRDPSLSAGELKRWVVDAALRGLVREPGAGSPNRMLHHPC